MVKRLKKENVRIPEGQATAVCTYKLMLNDIFEILYLFKLALCMYVHTYTFGFNYSCLICHKFIKIIHQHIKLH